MIYRFKTLFLCLLFFGCSQTQTTESISQGYTSETLEVQKISDHIYQHISFLQTESFGKVSCNGMVVVDNKEAIIFDTPTNDSVSEELINWVEQELGSRIIAVIPTHFHNDCLGGLAAFHERGIPSYANHLTIALSGQQAGAIPSHGFDTMLELKVGNRKVVAEYFGEGHTKDNVIGYFPDEKTVFGGCLIKEAGAGKGFLGDANTAAWPLTVAKLKAKYPDARLVIPGHGKTGGTELLDYTIKLFAENQ